MPTSYNKPNKYDYVSRKVFDRQVDRGVLTLARVKKEIRDLEDHLQKVDLALSQLILEVAELTQHVAQHCLQLDEDRLNNGNEELE